MNITTIYYLTPVVLSSIVLFILVGRRSLPAAFTAGVALAFIAVGSTLIGSPYLSLFGREPFQGWLAPTVHALDARGPRTRLIVGGWLLYAALVLALWTRNRFRLWGWGPRRDSK